MTLVLIGLASIALLLFLTLALKLHPFVALLSVSIVVALVAGIPVSELAATIEEGLGGSLGHIALIVALGAMIGRIVEESGGAEALATAMIARFGDRRLPGALALVGFLVGMPVFFEVGIIMLMPIVYGCARRTGGRLLPVALPMCIAVLIVHALIPPHPGATAIAGLFKADIGRMLLFGLPVAAVTTIAAAYAARLIANFRHSIGDEIHAKIANTVDTSPQALASQPPVRTIILLILLPIVLILGDLLGPWLLPTDSPLLPVVSFLGIPFVALLADVLLSAWLLGRHRGWSRSHVAHVINDAIMGVAVVILITGGGAIFAKVLVKTGIGDAIADLLHQSGLPLLLLGFVLTMLIRALQGPTTVALITAGGIIGPFVATVGLDANHIALLCIAMGAGGIAVSHINDAGFWIVTQLLGLDVRDGLKTWTLLTTIAGLVAFAVTALLWVTF